MLIKIFSVSVIFFVLQFQIIGQNLGGDQINTNFDSFLNPILSGDFPDPTIIRDGNDYYMTHSSMNYMPGLLVQHSTDLINWEPISNALTEYIGSVWAPDICKYNDKFYIYFTVAGKGNFVVTADNPYGNWTIPVKLDVEGIDPGHVVDEDGNRWIFMSGGYRVKLTKDGLSTIKGTFEKVYDGWQFPIEWETDGFNLEGPKVKKIGEYYYLLAAQGGTAGPPTCHMVISARSKSINGPWENSPYNPLVRTWSNDEKWWAKGHGSIINTPEGNWFVVYHAYENGFVGRGRQTLIEPVEFTKDDWPVALLKRNVENPIPKPIKSDADINRLEKLNEFRIGKEWKFFERYDPKRISFNNETLTLTALGNAPHNSVPMLFVPNANNYEISAEIEIDSLTVAGLLFFYNKDYYVGTGIDTVKRIRWRKGGVKGTWDHNGSNKIWLKIRVINHIVTGYYSSDGVSWTKEIWGMDISGYHHNTLYGFISILPGLFAYGKGEAKFTNFEYNIIN